MLISLRIIYFCNYRRSGFNSSVLLGRCANFEKRPRDQHLCAVVLSLLNMLRQNDRWSTRTRTQQDKSITCGNTFSPLDPFMRAVACVIDHVTRHLHADVAARKRLVMWYLFKSCAFSYKFGKSWNDLYLIFCKYTNEHALQILRSKEQFQFGQLN